MKDVLNRTIKKNDMVFYVGTETMKLKERPLRYGKVKKTDSKLGKIWVYWWQFSTKKTKVLNNLYSCVQPDTLLIMNTDKLDLIEVGL